ncbi:tol-pal system YbgF family protein [Bacterioplanoides pacificum]|uniref:Tol-pal system YbgF family protein n=1 Tax=Bacterioplanoides pacificum TaxID=1171596 RepID=A0ABV7VQY7_9GAMM
MNKLIRLTASLVLLLLSGCALFQEPAEQQLRLENIQEMKIRLMTNDTLEVSHDEVIERYQGYLAVSAEAEMRIRVAHRIASLKLQSEEVAQERLEAARDALDNSGGQTDEQQRHNLAELQAAELALEQQTSSEERSMARASINDYEALLKQYPDRLDNDAVLYQLAKAYTITAQPYQAIAVLEELTRRFPRSVYYLEAEFRSGQMLYAAGDYQAAADAYQRLIERGRDDNPYYVSAGYLKGWSLFKLEQNEAALLAFTRVMDEEYPDVATLESAKGGEQEMLQDILRVMALIFDYQGDWQQIAVFFDQYGKRHYEYLIYDQLASQYYDKKYYKSGASALRAFVLRYPQDHRAPAYYQRLVEGYKTARYPTLLRKHKTIYIQRFGVGSDYWNSHGEHVRETIRRPLAGYIWDLASFHHAWGQRSKKRSDKLERLGIAARWYQEYVRSFPLADDTVKAHFLLAEVAAELRDYELAKNNYEIVAYQYPDYEQAAEAGYAAILAYNRFKPGVAEAPVWRQLTVASAMRFVQEFPQDSRRGTVLVNTAEMLLKDKYYPQALSTSRLAWQAKGELPQRYKYGAALVRGHASFELQQYAESEMALLEASRYQKLSAKKRRELREKVAAAIYKQGEVAKQAGDATTAVIHWRRLAEVIPESNTRINAEYDAATILMETGDYDQAIEVLLQFRQDYPAHKLVADIPSKLIIAYEEKGDWRNAAFELQTIWKISKKADEQRIACFQSAEYFEKAGDQDNAIVMYKRYAHSYKRPFDAAVEAHFKLDQIYASRGDEEKRRFWLAKIIALNAKANDQQTDRSKYLAAKAAYELGEFERLAFEKVNLTLPLDRSVTRKNTFMQAALKRYTQAVQLGVLEYTTSSTFRIGELYKQLAQGLMNSERPAGMDELELEEYQFLLEDQAFPLEEAAINVHQTNIGRTYDGLYDSWVKRSFSAMAELMPGQYNKQERAVSYVEQIR